MTTSNNNANATISATSNNKGSAGPRCQKETRYEEQRQTIYSHSTVTFIHEGKQHTLRFNK